MNYHIPFINYAKSKGYLKKVVGDYAYRFGKGIRTKRMIKLLSVIVSKPRHGVPSKAIYIICFYDSNGKPQRSKFQLHGKTLKEIKL